MTALTAPVAASLYHLAFLTILTDKKFHNGIPLYFTVIYLAAATGGAFMALALRRYETKTALLMAEAMKIITLALLATSKSATLSLPVILSSAFIFQVTDIFVHTNKYRLINSLYNNDVGLKNFKITRLQIVETMSGIISPLIASAALWTFSLSVGFLLPILISLGHLVLWFSVDNGVFITKKDTSFAAGYAVLFSDKRLTNMLLARMAGNIPFIFWNLILPMTIQRHFSKSAFAGVQAMSLSLMALGLFAVNYFVPRLHANHHVLEKPFLKISPFPMLIGLASLALYYFELLKHPILFLIAFLFGISNGALRTGGILLGQKITPPEILHLVMAAGDGIVRIISAIMALGLGLVLANQESHYGFLFGLAAGALAIILSCQLYVGLANQENDKMLHSENRATI